MRPKYLEFVGLNSFQEEAKIDFDALFAGGIFGVFGRTGAGKTTILDAISYALYGEVSRKKINQADFINKNCKKMIVRYTFEMQEKHERVLYCVERTLVGRAKSTSSTAVLYRNTIAIAEKQDTVTEKIKEILGLTHTEFNKCIILPQGEFTQFIKQGNKDRLDLICKLFNLKKYMKLEEYVRESFKDIKAEKISLQTQQIAYEQYNVEQEKELKKEITRQKKEQDKLKIELEENKKLFERLQEEYNTHTKRVKVLQELKELPSKAELADMEVWLENISDMQQVLQESRAICQEEKKLNAIEMQLKTDTLEIESRNKSLQELLEIERKENFSEQKIALNAEKMAIGNLQNSQEEITKIHREIIIIQKEYKEKQNAESNCNAEIEKLLGRIQKGEIYLKNMPTAGDYLAENLGGALLREEFLQNFQYFSSQKERILQYQDNSILYQKVDAELDKQIEKYSKKIAEKTEIVSSDSVIAEYKRQQNNYEKYKTELEKLRSALAVKEKSKSELASDIKNLERNIAEKSEQHREKTEQLEQSLQGKSLIEYRESLQKKLDKLIREEQILKTKIESEQKTLNGLQIAVIQGQTEQKNSLEKLENLKNSVNKLLSSLKYDKIEEIEIYAKKYSNAREVKNLIQKVRDNQNLLDNLPAYDFTEQKLQQYMECKKSILELQSQWDNLNSTLGANTANLQQLQKQLFEKEKLSTALQALQEEFDLKESLNKCLGQCKFVNFVANNYLKNICQEANGTLLQLTSNRYYLEYREQETDFFVLDNFADGEARKIHTLSGGESFLVSLSLALALSSSIYRHSLNKIEFFFLDEGFGTLDSELVETVLDALTKLKKNNFIIGLISHVEELKARIPHQLVVYRDGTKGSKVEIKT